MAKAVFRPFSFRGGQESDHRAAHCLSPLARDASGFFLAFCRDGGQGRQPGRISCTGIAAPAPPVSDIAPCLFRAWHPEAPASPIQRVWTCDQDTPGFFSWPGR